MFSSRALFVCLFVSACHVLATTDKGTSNHARRDILATREVRRTRAAACFDDAAEEVRSISYNGSIASLSVAYANWASARSVPSHHGKL